MVLSPKFLLLRSIKLVFKERLNGFYRFYGKPGQGLENYLRITPKITVQNSPI